MENFYQILDIEKNVTSKEVKKAYNKLLRKYPPEKEPEKYKEIREAYETLKDEENRKSYNIFFSYGDELKKLEEKGRKALEEEEYETAIRAFKKMLVLSESLAYIRNLLAMAYIKSGEVSIAIQQYQKLIIDFPKNSDYYLGLGFAYEESGNTNEAKKKYKKAFEIDNENFTAISNLVEILWEEKKFYECEVLLRECIEADGEVDFNDFQFFFKLLMTHLFNGNSKKMEQTLDEIIKIVPNDKETKDYVAWELARLSYQLYEAKMLKVGWKVTIYLEKLAPNDPEFKLLIQHGKAAQEFDRLKEDSTVLQVFKFIVACQLDNSYNNVKHKEAMDVIKKEKIYSVKISLKNLKNKYPNSYSLEKELFNNLLKIVTETQNKNNYSGNNQNSSSCFIATLCYQDNDCYEVRMFRKWRDENLNNHSFGKFFIKVYYKISPTITKKLINFPKIVNAIRRVFLDRILDSIEKKNRCK